MAEFREFVEAQPHKSNDFDVLSAYLKRTKVSEISSNTGKSVGEIYRILKKHSVNPNRLRANHSYVANFADSGMSISQIAELTGYSKRNVRYILSNNRLDD